MRALRTIYHKIEKTSEMYGSLRNVRKSQKGKEVSEMYGSIRMYLKTLLYIKTVKKLEKKH